MPLLTITTEREINARVDRVWSLLTDFPGHAQWNPFIPEISGDLVQGGKLQVLIEPPGKKAMRFKPTLLTVAPNQELRWRGVLLMGFFFAGEHFFQLSPIKGSSTRFIQGEIFSGLLAKVLMNSQLASIEQGFNAMNLALKELAESPA
ncbi:MAG: SRPBCC domain-containing protein [Desulfovibrio sp.]|nr:MAG: SRPBCC domain-containing protein [Desulfovibrio sp.]